MPQHLWHLEELLHAGPIAGVNLAASNPMVLPSHIKPYQYIGKINIYRNYTLYYSIHVLFREFQEDSLDFSNLDGVANYADLPGFW